MPPLGSVITFRPAVIPGQIGSIGRGIRQAEILPVQHNGAVRTDGRQKLVYIRDRDLSAGDYLRRFLPDDLFGPDRLHRDRQSGKNLLRQHRSV